MTRFHAAIFDLDGTLVNTLEDLADSMNAVLAEFGMPTHPPEPYRFFVGLGMRKLAEQAAPAKTPAATLDAMTERMHAIYADRWAVKSRPYPGIPELTATLADRGLLLAVLSNKPDEFTRKVVAHYFPDGMFAAVMGAKADVPRKPDPAGALIIASKFSIPPADFLYFGDTNTDMKTGLAAGMHTVGVSWGFRPVSELTGAGAQAIIDRPEQALDLL